MLCQWVRAVEDVIVVPYPERELLFFTGVIRVVLPGVESVDLNNL
jgi:hypothetical protein